MKAVILAEGNRVAVQEVPDARIERPTDALVEVTVASICMTDVHIKNGVIRVSPGKPIGHEFVGKVREVGSEITHFKSGDRVGSIPAIYCGTCPECRSGVPQNCPNISMYGGGRRWPRWETTESKPSSCASPWPIFLSPRFLTMCRTSRQSSSSTCSAPATTPPTKHASVVLPIFRTRVVVVRRRSDRRTNADLSMNCVDLRLPRNWVFAPYDFNHGTLGHSHANRR